MADVCFLTDQSTVRGAPAQRWPSAPAASELWDELFSGRWKVAAQLSTETHCYLNLVAVSPASNALAVSPTHQRLFERVVLGESQKLVALETDRSRAGVSSMLHECLRTLGLSCKFRRLPLPLALIAHARASSGPAASFSISPETNSLVVTVQRPDQALQRWLSASEYSVARLVMEGKSHAEIAAVRGTSQRTVANQLQSVFSKLKVSGRLELIRFALSEPPTTARSARVTS
ncbi:MAG: helix-turn-helix transcriptional regulator [Pseudomonadota bacterium]